MRWTLALAAVGTLGMLSVWDRFVDSMVFQPTPGVDLTLARAGLALEQVQLHTEDGVRLHAFFLPSPGASRAVLFLHGNAGNASHRLPNAARLARLGAHVLLLDYRGYGLSEGRPDEAGVYADARAGLKHLLEERAIEAPRVVVLGRSLGGAVAIDLARDRQLGGVILESTFPSIADVAKRTMFAPFWFLVRGRFDSIGKIGDVKAPLLFFHGDRDDLVHLGLGRQLFDAAPEPKAFEVIAGAGHNDTVLVGGRAYFARIGRFLDEVTPP